MKKSLFLMLCLVITGCSGVETPPKPISPTAQAIATITAPTTNIPVNPCWNKLPNIPNSTTLPGKLVLSSYNRLSILDFEQNTRRELSGKLLDYAAVSPNGEWLAYNYKPDGEKEKLVIESADGQAKAQVPVGQGWLMYTGMPWLDNERLWFSVFPDIDKVSVAPVIIINLLTGNQQEIASNYPGLERSVLSPVNDPGLHFGYSSVIYSPSLQMVVYQDGSYMTLWDRQSKKTLAEIRDIGRFGELPPLWLPDGMSVVAPTRPDLDSPREWWLINSNGTTRQLTHFQDLYGNKFEIGNYYSLSPDGNYLAFGLSQNAESDGSESKQLLLLNLTTLDVVNTCALFNYPKPVWSPDGQYLAVTTLIGRKPSANVVINVKDQWIADLQEGVESKPVGWLKSP